MVLYYKSVTREPEPEPNYSHEEPPMDCAIKQAATIKTISSIPQIEHVAPVSHISIDSLMGNNDHYNHQIAMDKVGLTDQQIFDDVYKTPFTNKKALRSAYRVIIENNFNNLSLDDKLIVMHRTNMYRDKTNNNYILICLTILILIALKLFSN